MRQISLKFGREESATTWMPSTLDPSLRTIKQIPFDALTDRTHPEKEQGADSAPFSRTSMIRVLIDTPLSRLSDEKLEKLQNQQRNPGTDTCADDNFAHGVNFDQQPRVAYHDRQQE